MDKSIVLDIIKSKEVGDFLPHMSPDVIDDFVTWLYERVDIRSFERSDLAYKLKMFKQFQRSLSPEKLQLSLNLTPRK